MFNRCEVCPSSVWDVSGGYPWLRCFQRWHQRHLRREGQLAVCLRIFELTVQQLRVERVGASRGGASASFFLFDEPELRSATPPNPAPSGPDEWRRPFWLMRILRTSMLHGGYVSSDGRVYVPRRVWVQKGARFRSVSGRSAPAVTASTGRARMRCWSRGGFARNNVRPAVSRSQQKQTALKTCTTEESNKHHPVNAKTDGHTLCRSNAMSAMLRCSTRGDSESRHSQRSNPSGSLRWTSPCGERPLPSQFNASSNLRFRNPMARPPAEGCGGEGEHHQ